MKFTSTISLLTLFSLGSISLAVALVTILAAAIANFFGIYTDVFIAIMIGHALGTWSMLAKAIIYNWSKERK